MLQSNHNFSQNYFQAAVCCQKNKGQLICCSKNCSFDAILCKNKNSCKCWQNHNHNHNNHTHHTHNPNDHNHHHPTILQLQQLFFQIQQRIIFSSKVQECLDSMFQSMIEYMKQFRERLKYISLRKNERRFFDLLKFHKEEQIKGNDVFVMMDQSKGKQTHQTNSHDDNEIVSCLQKVWLEETEIIKTEFKRIRHKLKNMYDTPNSEQLSKQETHNQGKQKKRTIDSSIIENHNELKKIREFFPAKKHIYQMNLLYRASKYNFQVKYFHEKCQKIQNTLVLIKTKHGKILGGFTPLKWPEHRIKEEISIKKHGQRQVDLVSSQQSPFIFSLTNNDKFLLTKEPSKAIQYWSNEWGPIFGGDLKICNNANVDKWSGCLINQDYFNEKYARNDQESYMKLTGERGYQFLVEEWEVFEVLFKQQL